MTQAEPKEMICKHCGLEVRLQYHQNVPRWGHVATRKQACECDHLVGSHQYEGLIEASLVQRDPEQYSGIPKFTYCPKCGEEL